MRERIIVTAIFVFLAMLSLWPLPDSIGNRLPTYPIGAAVSDSDSFMFCWNLWWVHGWITGEHPLLFTQSLHHPFGVPLIRHTLSLGNGLIAVPFFTWYGLPAMHNLLLLFHAFLTGIGTYLLARELHVRRTHAVIAGEIALLWPARTIHTTVHLNLAGTGWIPLSLWLLLKSIHEKRPGYAICAGLTTALAGATCWYHLLFIALIFWLVIPITTWRTVMGGILYSSLLWIISIALLLPLLLPLLTPDPDIPDRTLEEKAVYSIQPLSLLIPSILHPLWKHRVTPYYEKLPGNPVESVAYIGIIPLICLIAGLIRGTPAVRKWLIASGCLMIASWGPYVSMAALNIPMPYLLLEQIPGMSIARTPGRLMIPCGITLSIGIALFLTSPIGERIRSRRWTGLIGCLLVLDFCPAPIPVIPAQIPPIYDILAQHPASPPGVLEVPNAWNIRQYQYNQTRHARPITTGFVSRVPVSVFYRNTHLPLLRNLSNPQTAAETLLHADPVALSDLLTILQSETLIVHREFMPDTPDRVFDGIRQRFSGNLLAKDDQRTIFSFPTGWNQPAPTNIRFYFTDHWYPMEQWKGIDQPACWAGIHPATVHMFNPDQTPVRIQFEVLPAKQDDDLPQELELCFNGDPVLQIQLPDPPRWTTQTAALSGSVHGTADLLEFRFRHASRPVDVTQGSNPDARYLAAAIRGLTITQE